MNTEEIKEWLLEDIDCPQEEVNAILDSIQNLSEELKPVFEHLYKTGEYPSGKYKDDLELEENTPYTLTFYARTDGDMIIASYLTDCVDGTYLTGYTQFIGDTTEMNSTYGTTYSRIGSEVRKYTVHWYNQNSGTRK